MAGHSKWANIQHRKQAQDAKRGKLFTKLIREITVAARMGGPDVATNPRLRAAVESARESNMPGDTVTRAIKRGEGSLDGQNLEEVRYEGYGPSGVAVMVECVTDNRNRTVSEVRHAFSKRGGNLGTDGSVGYLFTKVGQLLFSPGSNEDLIMEAALEAGADDVKTYPDQSIEVLTPPEVFSDVKAFLVGKGLSPEFAELSMQAAIQVPLSGEDAEQVIKLIDMLEELDDVQNVYTNAQFDD